MTEALIASIEVNKIPPKKVKDIPANKMIDEIAKFFKEKNLIKAAKWSDFVKTGHANDIHPKDSDYWYPKAAAICRTLYVSTSTTLGIGKFRVIFGKKKRRGAQPCKSFRSGGSIIRNIVAQLKKAGYIASYKSDDENTKTGLYLTKEGRSQLDKIAAKIAKQ